MEEANDRGLKIESASCNTNRIREENKSRLGGKLAIFIQTKVSAMNVVRSMQELGLLSFIMQGHYLQSGSKNTEN